MVSHTYLIFRNKQDIKHFLFLLAFSYHWEISYKAHCQWCWVKFTHAGHVILQLILWKLWSKTSLHAFQTHKLPILTSQLCQAWRAIQNMVSHSYLIFRNKWDITHFLFLLTFSYHWGILYEPHCQWYWVKFTNAGHVILQLILWKLWSKTSLWALQPHKLPIHDTSVASSSKSHPKTWCHTPTFMFRNKWDIKHFLFLLAFSYDWEISYELHCQWCWVKFTHAAHVILQLILWKLWSKTSLHAFQPHKLPILKSPLHPAWRATPNMVSHPYLIFRNKWDIKHFLFLLTFSFHWEISYELHCQWCWFKFTHAAHVILQLILWKLWSKTSLWAFQPHKLPILKSQLHPAWRPTPNMVSHPYLIFRNKWDIKHFLFLLTFSYHWKILYELHCQWC